MAVKVKTGFTAWMLPRAQCENCNWSNGCEEDTKDLAKLHIQQHPTHQVTVVREQRSLWYGE